MNWLQVEGISKAFGGVAVLHDITFGLDQHSTLAVLGDSGCGKTTLLRLLSGLIRPDAGSITLGGVPLERCGPGERGILYLGQEALLFDHLDCFENVAFALRMRRVRESEVKKRVTELLAATGLERHGLKRAHQLSGGQKQRAAFARAVLAEPRVLLLDEPFGSLDGTTRSQMQELFGHLARRYGITALFVTHDLKEALRIGDHFATLNDGHLTRYANRSAFLDDDQTGVRAEIAFWSHLQHTCNQPGIEVEKSFPLSSQSER